MRKSIFFIFFSLLNIFREPNINLKKTKTENKRKKGKKKKEKRKKGSEEFAVTSFS